MSGCCRCWQQQRAQRGDSFFRKAALNELQRLSKKVLPEGDHYTYHSIGKGLLYQLYLHLAKTKMKPAGANKVPSKSPMNNDGPKKSCLSEIQRMQRVCGYSL